MTVFLSENDGGYVSLIDVKPGTRRALVRGVIVELLDDPPQSTTNIREHRYHYRLADASASAELAVPHGVLQDLVSKNFNTLAVVPGHNLHNINHVVFPTETRGKTPFDEGSGFVSRAMDGITMNFVHGETRNIGAERAEDSDWSGWSEDEQEESLKWLLQPGDVISINVATVWSHGRMVIVPNLLGNEMLLKVGKLATDFKLEPDVSRLYNP